MKKIISLLISIILCISLLTPVFATNNNNGIGVSLDIIEDLNNAEGHYVPCYGIIRAHKNSTLLWEYTTEKTSLGDMRSITDVYTNNDTVYILVNHILYAFDIETGNTKWTLNDLKGVCQTLTFDKYGNVYISSYMGSNDIIVSDKNGRELYRKDNTYRWINKIEISGNNLVIEYSDGLEYVTEYLDISQFKPVTVEIDGKEIEFDQLPIIIDGRTLVPVRAIIEAMGGDVLWDDTTNTATLILDNNTIVLTLDSTTAYLNNEVKTLDVPPRLINNRTLMPIRFIAEGFNFKVSWNDTSKIVSITKETVQQNSDVVLNDTLLSCLGKTKADIVSVYGDIVDVNYFEGGKYYIHHNSASEFYYTNKSYDYDYDNVYNDSKCTTMFAKLSELIESPNKNTYSMDELKNFFGDYEFTNYENGIYGNYCQYKFKYEDYEFIVESDYVDPIAEYIFIYRLDFLAFIDFTNNFFNTPLTLQAEPYNTILNDDYYLTSMQSLLSCDYLDIDMDGADELIISSKILSDEYELGGSCFSVWDYSAEKGVYKIFAKAGMSARSAQIYLFIEKDGEILLLESSGMSNSAGRNSYRTLYKIRDGEIIPVLALVYDTYTNIYTINGEPHDGDTILDLIEETSSYPCLIKHIYE